MENILGIPGDFILYMASGIAGMLVGGGAMSVVAQASKMSKKKLIAGVTVVGALGYIVGSAAGWYLYEMFR